MYSLNLINVVLNIFRHILGKCGDTEITLAHEYIKMDIELEEDVFNPLQVIIENDIPNIMKHKKNLAKLILDMDAARTRSDFSQ